LTVTDTESLATMLDLRFNLLIVPVVAIGVIGESGGVAAWRWQPMTSERGGRRRHE